MQSVAMKCVVIFTFLLVGFCIADLPTELPDLDNFEAIKTRCDTKGGAGTYDKLKKAQNETEKCLKGLIDLETVGTELDEAKKTGSMDEVFGKYCRKRPEMRECVKKTVDVMKTCLEESEKQALNSTSDILEKIGDFACYRDGDRLAMFIAEGGVQCLQSRSENIMNCVNQTIKFNPTTFSPNSIPNLTVDTKKCDDLTTIQTCVVKDLEDHCEDSTPSNMIDAVFKFVKKNVCKKTKRKRSIRLKRNVKKTITAIPDDLPIETQRKLEATCQKYGRKTAYKELLISLNDSINCLQPIRMLVTPYSVFQRSLTNCTSGVRGTLRNCLSDEGKYYPDFLLERLQAFYGFMYKHADKFLVTSEANAEFANCIQAINPEKELITCMKKTIGNANDTFYHIAPKAELCRLSAEGDSCLSTRIKNICVQDVKITKFVDSLIEAIQVPCQKMGDTDQ